MTGVLVLLRHGESTANQAGTFSGLLDVPLTRHGVQQARAAGILLGEHGIFPHIAFTSTLQRAVRTAELVKSAVGRDYPTEPIWQLNERNYGALTGVTKTHARAELGEAEFSHLRRSLHGCPPAMSLRSWIALRRSPALRRLPAEAVRRSESLSDVVHRLQPVLTGRLLPAVQAGMSVLVVAHGNSLRALCTCIDGLSERELENLNLPTGQPLLYAASPTGSLTPRGGTYLDPTAPDAAATVAAEGGT